MSEYHRDGEKKYNENNDDKIGISRKKNVYKFKHKQ